jgi:polysaccharide export outer membrane protein
VRRDSVIGPLPADDLGSHWAIFLYSAWQTRELRYFMRSNRLRFVLIAILIALDFRLEAQQPNTPAPAQPLAASPNQLVPSAMEQVRANYTLGPNDQILIRAVQVDEIGQRPYRIDGEGNIDLPLIGTVKAGGLSVDQLERELGKRLVTYVRNPQVSVTVVQYRSEPVFFIGAFRVPGIYSLQGSRTLVEMLSSIGGLQPNASRRITITRRLEYGGLTLPNAVVDKATNTSTVEIGMGSLRDNVNPAEDIVLQPYDEIYVSREEMVFVSGEVGKVGGVPLEEREFISVTQALSISGGLTHEADAEKARVLRPILNTSKRAEIPVNLKLVLAGRADDYPLLPNDVLYIPRKRSRTDTLGKISVVVVPAVVTGLLYVALR